LLSEKRREEEEEEEKAQVLVLGFLTLRETLDNLGPRKGVQRSVLKGWLSRRMMN
jgi:hypothetical protein